MKDFYCEDILPTSPKSKEVTHDLLFTKITKFLKKAVALQ